MRTGLTPAQNDLASSVGKMATIWGPGVLLIVLTGPLGGWPRTIGWTAGLLWLAAFCLLNSARCQRVHCRFTGPFFLVMAGVTMLAGVGIGSIGADTWNVISGTILVGGVVLYYLPELIWGRYWRRSER